MEVSPAIAKECMQNFEDTIQGSDLKKIQDSLTTSVSFITSDLASWLNDNNYLTNTTNIRISFGIYTKNAAQALGIPQSEGRLTAFIWPIEGSQELAPYNFGDLKP